MVGMMLDATARTEIELRKDAFISMTSHELRSPLTFTLPLEEGM
jgi:signal transduction histidine kinase